MEPVDIKNGCGTCSDTRLEVAKSVGESLEVSRRVSKENGLSSKKSSDGVVGE